MELRKPATFKLQPAVAEKLTRCAADRNMTKTAVVELAICQLVEQTAPPIDRASIEQAIESLRALKASAGKAGVAP